MGTEMVIFNPGVDMINEIVKPGVDLLIVVVPPNSKWLLKWYPPNWTAGFINPGLTLCRETKRCLGFFGYGTGKLLDNTYTGWAPPRL